MISAEQKRAETLLCVAGGSMQQVMQLTIIMRLCRCNFCLDTLRK
jgi:hypothetical protein